MNRSSPRRTLWTAAASTALLLLCTSVNSVAAADVNVCALPASALYFNKIVNTITRSPTAAAANGTTTASNSSEVRTKCWSDSTGVTVDAACVTACACRHLDYETSAIDKSTQPFGMCLNNSMNFRCATESGLADCSAYALNAEGSHFACSTTLDGSSTLKNSSSSERPQVNDDVPPIGVIATGDDKKSGLKAWVWAIIVVAIVLVVGLIIFTIGWFKNRPKYGKNSSSLYERTTAMDAWKDGGDSLEDEAPLSGATTAATAYTAMPAAPEAEPSIVAGVSGVDYHTYRLGASTDQTPFMDNDSDLEQQRTLISSRISDNDSSSIELHSPVYHQQQPERKSSLTGRFGERLTGGSRLSYASASSYGSEMDSFTSQLTFEESEPHDAALENQQAQYQQYQDAPYPRKKSTEF